MKNRGYYRIIRLASCILFLLTVACGAKDKIPGGGNTPAPPPPEKEEITPDEGMTLYGLVADADGNPLSGVVVSDGFTCAATDTNGVYQIKRNRSSKYAYLSMPSGYEVAGQSGFGSYPEFYKSSKSLTGSNQTPHRVDFTLKKRPSDDRNFILIAMGDPQPDNDVHVQRFRQETVEDIKQEIKRFAGKSIVGVGLGDIIGKPDEKTPGARLTKIKSAMGDLGFPTFCCCGNHDKDRLDMTGGAFENIMGPLYYSFNIGDVHFVVMDNIRFYGSDYSDYTKGFTDNEVAWLKEDLKFVPKDKRIIICYHAPMYDNFITAENGKAIFDQIQSYTTPAAMAAHTHTTRYYVNSTYGMREYIFSATCGFFWRSNNATDGIPNGYYVFEFNGTEITNSYFKGTGWDRSFQIRLCRGNAVYGGTYTSYRYEYTGNDIIANVFFAGDDWSLRAYEDGVPTDGKFSKIAGSHGDYWAYGYAVGVLQNKPTSMGACYHLYKYTLKNPAAQSIRIEAEDPYGNVYYADKLVPDNDFSTEAPGN